MTNKAKAPTPIPFGEYRPDTAHANTPFLTECIGAVATGSGYAPMKALTAVGGGGTVTGTTLDGVAVGFGASLDIVAGTATALYEKLPAAASWTDITRAAGGAYAATYWSFCKFGTTLIAANGVDAPQAYTIGGGAKAAALAGSPPVFNYVATCGDFVFGLGVSTNDTTKRTLRWSGINDATSWTVGTDLCDEQVFPDGGDLLGAVGDKQGYIIQRDAIRRFRFLPGDTITIFEFEKIEGLPGCIAHYAWAVHGGTLYYVSHSGIVALSDSGYRMIGVDRADEYFKTNYGATKRTVADPFTGRIMWPISSLLWSVYDPKHDRWTQGQEASTTVHAWLVRLDATSSTLTYPLAIISTGALQGLAGSNQQLTLHTAPLELTPARRTFVNGMRFETDAAPSTHLTTVTPYETLDTAGSGVSGSPNTTTGEDQIHVSGRYLKFRLILSAGTTWTYANRFEVWPISDGEY